MKNQLKLLTVSIFSTFSFTAFAVTNGYPDCEDNQTNLNCKHPNVLMASLFDESGVTITGTRCSASLIKADQDKAVILTAGHCVDPIIQGLVQGNYGVSFDAKIFKPNPDGGIFNNHQFIMGAIPINNSYYQGYKTDYAAIVLPLQNGLATTVDGRQVNILDIAPVTLAPLGLMDQVNKEEVKLVDVGYGTNAIKTNPNDNGNAATVVRTEFGNRNISENGLYQNNSISGGMLLKIQQNLARDQSGTCFGDSGGPTFYLDASGKEIQVGIHSIGNNLTCNGWAGSYRVDIEQTQVFLKCLMVDGKSIDQLKACGVTLN